VSKALEISKQHPRPSLFFERVTYTCCTKYTLHSCRAVESRDSNPNRNFGTASVRYAGRLFKIFLIIRENNKD